MNPFEYLKQPPARRFTTVEAGGVEWHIQSLTEREYLKVGEGGTSESAVTLLLLCLVDPNGNRIFGEEHREAWHEKDGGVVQKIANACLAHIDAEAVTEKN